MFKSTYKSFLSTGAVEATNSLSFPRAARSSAVRADAAVRGRGRGHSLAGDIFIRSWLTEVPQGLPNLSQVQILPDYRM